MSQNGEIGNGKSEMGNRVEWRAPMGSNYKFLPSLVVWSVLLGFLVRSSSEPLLSRHVLSTGAERDHVSLYFCASIIYYADSKGFGGVEEGTWQLWTSPIIGDLVNGNNV